MPTPTQDVFSLRKILPAVDSYPWLRTDFAAHGDWEHVYRLYSLAPGVLAKKGHVTVQRRAGEQGEVSLHVRIEREAQSNTSYFVDTQLTCIHDTLCTPQHFTTANKMAAAYEASPLPFTAIEKQGLFQQGQLELRSGRQAIRFPLTVPYTFKWCLFDAVQQLADPNLDPIRFSLIDENDQIWPDQVLRFYRRVSLENEHGTQTLTALEHVGPGVIPFVFWIDEQGRLLFVMTGIEAYVLIQENGHDIKFNEAGRLVPKSSHAGKFSPPPKRKKAKR